MIRLDHVTVAYSQERPALHDISLTIEEGKIVGIIGPNGAGKSTLMKAILGLIDSKGQIAQCDGDEDLHGRIAYVEQRSQIDIHFPMTVKECVSLGIYPKVGLFRRLGKKEWQEVEKVLDTVGLLDLQERPITDLSGGQFQRMLLARCLVQDLDYLFLDEPFVGIDSVSEQMMVHLLKDLSKNGKTIVIVHHDLSKVEEYFDQLILLNTKLVAYGPVQEVFTPDYLRAAYGELIFLDRSGAACDL